MTYSELIHVVDKLTPVESIEDMYYKRDDLLTISGMEVIGGKLRQYVHLFNDMQLDGVFDKCKTVVVPTSVVSPQGMIVTFLANIMGLKTILVIGNSDRNIDSIAERNPTIRKAVALGAEVVVGSALGFGGVLYAKAEEIAKENNGVVISFSHMFDRYRKAIIDSTSRQVENLPFTDNIVIQVGSAYQAAGILKGLEARKTKSKIYLIQTAGYDRVDIIEKSLPFIHNLKYEFIIDKTYPYSKKIEEYTLSEVKLDSRYEAKAHRYMRTEMNLTGSTLFWIIGNNDTATKD